MNTILQKVKVKCLAKIYIYDFKPVLGWTTFRQENTWASLDF